MHTRGTQLILQVCLLLVLAVTPAFSQGSWIANLNFDPFPSPYISDWENNPAIGQAFITNGTSSAVTVRVYLTLVHDTRGQIASANSRLFDFPPGQATSLTTTDLIDDKSVEYDNSIRELSVRTGRLPEGKYRICLRLESESGQLLLDNQCAEFSIVYPDPPYLIYPSNGEAISGSYPMLQWTPVQVPVGYQVHYDLQVSEMLPGQSPAQALVANRPHYRNTDITGTSLQYPFDALALQKGQTYAWQVQVLDDRGYPPATNNGRSEIWTFTCPPDTVLPYEKRILAGKTVDSLTGASLDSVRIVYRAVHPAIAGKDTSWTESQDSLECWSDNDGSFRFDSVLDKSFFSLTATRAGRPTVRLVGSRLFLSADIKDFKIPLPLAPPVMRRLAGVLRDFYSDEPVPNATVVYHVVEAERTSDSSGAIHLTYKENPRKKLETITDGSGRFEFTGATDSTFFSLRADRAPSFIPAADMGPDQRQVGDIDNYILLIKPNAGSITGTLRTTIGGKNLPVSKTLVTLVRTSRAAVSTTMMGLTTNTVVTVIDTVNQTAYSDAGGLFRFSRVNQEKPTSSTSRIIDCFFFKIPVRSTTTVLGYSYRIAASDPRYRPYLSPDSIVVTAGETTESGEHLLTPKSGAIVGRILLDTLPVEGAKVSLYPATRRQTTPAPAVSSGSKRAGSSQTLAGASSGESAATDNTTWGNVTTQRPDGEPLDMYQTDADGVYAFRSVPINDPQQATERYTIWVETQGYNPAEKADRIGAENETDTVNISLTRTGGILYGTVKSAAGAALGSARVDLQKYDSTSSGTMAWSANPTRVLSGGDGAYSFANLLPGTYRLQFSKDGYNPLTTDSLAITYGDKILYDADLSPAKGFILLTAKSKDEPKLGDVCVKSEQIPSLLGFTSDSGKIFITGAATGAVTLQLRKIGYADLDTTVQVVADETTKVAVTMDKPVGEILVRVVEKGKPDKRLANMTVKIGKTEAGKKPDTSLIKKTNDLGEIVFKEAPTGPQTVTVTPPTDSGYADDYVTLETETHIYAGLNGKPLIMELEPAARLEGKVKAKDDGAFLSGVAVTVDGNTKVKGESRSTGEFTLRGLPVGESVTLIAQKCGFRTAKFKYDKKIEAGDKITGITIELEKSPMDSLFGFPVALDSSKAGSNGHNRVWGSLLSVPATSGMKLKSEGTPFTFADLEVDSNYRPIGDSVALVQKDVEVVLFGIEAHLKNDPGLHLQWVDSVKAGRISGALTLVDPISKAFPESKFLDLTIPKKYSPSFWAGGVNHGLDRFGLTSTDKETQVKIKSVTLGIDFTKSNVDSAGLHLFGSIKFGTSFSVGFEEMVIGKDAAGDIVFKGVTIKTSPPIKIPLGVFTVVDSSMSWEASGFRASGAIVLTALDNKEFGFNDLRISPKGEFLSLTVTADEKNGTINVHGQKFQVEKLEFGTENADSQTAEHVRYFAFGGKLTISKLDKPVGLSLRYTEKGIFTGKLDINQTCSFGSVVTISLQSIELGYDSTKADRFIGISGGVKFTAIAGLNLQASNLRFYLGGGVSFDQMAMDFIAGPVQVKLSVAYTNSVFEGKGWFEVKPVISAGAEFRYGGPQDWWVRIISGTRIPIGPCEIVQASGGIGRKDDVWKFSVGGVVAPAKADKGIRLDLLVEVRKTPAGVIILGNAAVEVASGTQVGRATIEINLPEKRINGSIVFAMDFKALKASAQLDLGIKFGEYWYVYGKANIDVLKFFKADGVIVVANNWQWQHDGQTQLMSGIYVELNSLFRVDANWYVIKWGVNFDRHAMVYIGWNGDFSGKIDMSGGAYAWIGFGPFDLIQARATMGLTAHLGYVEPEWTAGARARFTLEGSIGWCGNANCWTICWKCFIKIFGHCVFALPTGAKACIGMDAYIEYATSKGMTWSISF